MIIILNGYMKDSLPIHSLHERDRNVRYRGKIPVSLCIKVKYRKNSDRKNPSSNLFKVADITSVCKMLHRLKKNKKEEAATGDVL